MNYETTMMLGGDMFSLLLGLLAIAVIFMVVSKVVEYFCNRVDIKATANICWKVGIGFVCAFLLLIALFFMGVM